MLLYTAYIIHLRCGHQTRQQVLCSSAKKKKNPFPPLFFPLHAAQICLNFISEKFPQLTHTHTHAQNAYEDLFLEDFNISSVVFRGVAVNLHPDFTAHNYSPQSAARPLVLSNNFKLNEFLLAGKCGTNPNR